MEAFLIFSLAVVCLIIGFIIGSKTAERVIGKAYDELSMEYNELVKVWDARHRQ